MPQLGESVVEGTISRWLKSPGEDVTEYEPLLEVASDKVDTEITAPTAGKLDRILVRAGETVKVGTILAYLAEQQAESDGKHTLSYEPETEA
ncbi:MAG TPA: 2-oxoglutarate dehydrogenase, E2 component, dihydrolipoamide succinyltransferase, partial [Chloroflexi bacterium]|nr:2-oxoglutarate dehydrogenase, E2 component, dihydrolipoamide succinyltransferase [Chloroflexota bacterium]